MRTNDPDMQTEKEIRTFWAAYKYSITGGLVTILLLVMGYSAYQQYQQRIMGQAAHAYYLLVPAFQQADTAPAIEQLHDIQQRYPDTIYAGLSTLHAVKHYATHQQYDEALHALEWIEAHSTDVLSVVAKLKRARIYLAQQKPEKALAITQENTNYSAENALIQGDAHRALQHYPQARAAYKHAMQYATHRQQYALKNLAKMKYNDLYTVGDDAPQ